MDEYVLKMQHITKYIFGASGKALRNTDVKILDDIDFDLKKGEIHALLGENGAGKTTLMKVLGGAIPQDQGEIILDGEAVRFANVREASMHGIAFVHQELNLCTNITVARNFFLGDELRGRFGMMKTKQMENRCREAINDLGFDVDPRKRLGELSTAQQQIVEIAKALAHASKIIIMDEPTASLTKKEIDMLFELLAQLKAKGVSVIYISHRLDEIHRIGDRMTVLRDGKLVGTITREEYSDEHIVSMMAGKTLSAYSRQRNEGGQTLLQARQLRIGTNTKPLDIEVKTGEVVGLCGLVGAGRSELMLTVFGARDDYGGDIVYKGKPYTGRSPSKSIDAGIVYLSEDRKQDGLVLQISVRENTTLAFLRRLFPRMFINRRNEKAYVAKTVEAFKVVCRSQEQNIYTLSGGNQQKVLFAKSYTQGAQLLLLDEPTRGIDVGAKAEIHRLIDAAAKDGVAVLMASSEMPELISLCDRVYVMRDGTVTGEVTDPALMTQEYLVGRVIGLHEQAANIDTAPMEYDVREVFQ